MIERFMSQIRATEERFQRHQAERRERLSNLESLNQGGELQMVEQPERILKRAVRLGMDEMVGRAIIATRETTLGLADKEPLVDLYERILEGNDLLGAAFLLQGAQVSRSIGRVVIRNESGRRLGFGTGFMISPRLMMTNNHVLDSSGTARASHIEFNYYTLPDGRDSQPVVFGLEPGVLFITNQELDFTIVAVEAVNADGVPVRSRNWNPLIAQTGKVLIGERVNVIQHPAGRPQELALRQNQIVDLLDNFIHYISDTEQGSSGSPVLNDQWELAALHHAGVPKRDPQNRILLKSGQPWNQDPSTIDEIEWIANEGVRISRIVDYINRIRTQLTPEQRQLLDEAFLPRPMPEQETAMRQPPHGAPAIEQTGGPVPGGPVPGGSIQRPTFDTEGNLLWNIPLRIRVTVGDQPLFTPISPATRHTNGNVIPQRMIDTQSTPAADIQVVEHVQLEAALSQLEAFADKPYYDAEQDERDRTAYYTGLDGNLRANTRFKRLHELLKRTHTNKLPYKEARLEYLYPWVDLHETHNGVRELRSIYSGRNFSPEQAIRSDLEIAAQREIHLRERMRMEGTLTEEGLAEALDNLEAQMPFNCEHVVPQSWFAKAQPMRGDLHHLFACEPDCNSFRGNTPYYQFSPEEEAFREACGRRDNSGNRFEPEAGKGAIARASLYFLLRYPGLIGDEAREMQFDRLSILLEWHRAEPVSLYERHRNAAIYAIQGNRNPLIDFPEWSDKIDFEAGFGMP